MIYCFADTSLQRYTNSTVHLKWKGLHFTRAIFSIRFSALTSLPPSLPPTLSSHPHSRNSSYTLLNTCIPKSGNPLRLCGRDMLLPIGANEWANCMGNFLSLLPLHFNVCTYSGSLTHRLPNIIYSNTNYTAMCKQNETSWFRVRIQKPLNFSFVVLEYIHIILYFDLWKIND